MSQCRQARAPGFYERLIELCIINLVEIVNEMQDPCHVDTQAIITYLQCIKFLGLQKNKNLTWDTQYTS